MTKTKKYKLTIEAYRPIIGEYETNGFLDTEQEVLDYITYIKQFFDDLISVYERRGVGDIKPCINRIYVTEVMVYE